MPRTGGSCSTPAPVFAESHDLATQFPAKVRESGALWWREARRYSNPRVVDPVPSLYRANRIEDAFADRTD